MEPALVSTVKEGLALKLETPYMIAASTLGLLSAMCVLPGDRPFSRPLEGLQKIFAWTGWASPVAWLDTAHQWMSDPNRIEATHSTFLLLTMFGTFFASYSRASFAALVGISGLVETGSVTQAWVLPLSILVAMLVIAGLLRPWNDDFWNRAGMTWFWMGMALLHCVLMLIAFVFGEQKGRTRPQPVAVELSLDMQRYIDKRLDAFGMPNLVPPVSIPPMVPSAAASKRLAQVHREEEIREKTKGDAAKGDAA